MGHCISLSINISPFRQLRIVWFGQW